MLSYHRNFKSFIQRSVCSDHCISLDCEFLGSQTCIHLGNLHTQCYIIRMCTMDLYFEWNIHQSLQNIPKNQLVQPALLQQKGGKGRKKLWLFEYLHESLCNPEMASCIQWIDQTKGIFQFVSKNKEKLAQLWGKRKGNQKTMTYQKMARALRNYGRTGEIIKIRRKLTYQFSEAILQRLSAPYFLEKEIFYSQYVQPDQGYVSLNNWNANYNYTYANYHELSHPDC